MELIKSNNSNLSELAGNIISDSKKLMKQQIQLVEARIGEEVSENFKLGAVKSTGLVFVAIALVMFSITLVNILNAVLHLDFWASYGITSLFFAIIGTLFLYPRGNHEKNSKTS